VERADLSAEVFFMSMTFRSDRLELLTFSYRKLRGRSYSLIQRRRGSCMPPALQRISHHCPLLVNYTKYIANNWYWNCKLRLLCRCPASSFTL